MIEQLTQEQIDKFPHYVKKWTDIGLNTEPLDFATAKDNVCKAYKVAKLEPPKWFFHFSSPVSSLHAIFMIDVLSGFSAKNTDTVVHGDTSEWLHIFEALYTQYSSQYSEPGVEWNDSTKARMLGMISKAYQDRDVKSFFTEHFNNFAHGAHNASWLAFYDFFYEEFGDQIEAVKDFEPFFEIAKSCGWWSPYTEVAILQDRPKSVVMNEMDVLHNVQGPAVEYYDGYKIYCIEGYWFPEFVVMDPNQITPDYIEKENNAEKRRILLERYGYERYFKESDCKVIDNDEVQVSVNDERKMPRMLVQTKQGDKFLVGTDGSTSRVYTMPVTRDVKTCREAHEIISGHSEDDCLGQS